MRVTITKKEKTYSLDAQSDQRILYAGLNQGLPLPYECATGTCGTCKARLVEGEIHDLWPNAPARSKLKTDRGEFLMCQSSAVTDCEIKIPGKLPTTDPVPDTNTGTITKCEKLTHDVLHFDVRLNAPMAFHAGQFVVMNVSSIDGGRAYSMVNCASATDTLEFVVKKNPDGNFSDWIFNSNQENQTVELFGPLGKAILHPDDEKNILCIAGGSGIAGILSILHHACETGYFKQHAGNVFFGVRTVKDMFYLDRLSEYVEQANGNLSVTIALSEHEGAVNASDMSHANLNYTTGFVTPVTMSEMADKCENTLAFIAGPPPMVDDAIKNLIMEAQLGPDQIRYDKFG